jgi:cold shock CspA family protein
MTGEIKKIVADKGFGFIKAEDHIEYFFHRTGFRGNWDELLEDFNAKQTIYVEFEVTEGQKGPRAENVERLDKPNDEEGNRGKNQRTGGQTRRYEGHQSRSR